MQIDVFISYSSEDKSVADAICAKLEMEGLRCWIAPRNVQPGDYYADAIVRAIGSSRSLVVVFSSSANQSKHVLSEIEQAFSRDVPIVPIRIDSTMPTDGMKYFMSTVHWMDAFTPPIEPHIDRLSASLAVLLAHERRRPGLRSPRNLSKENVASLAQSSRRRLSLYVVAAVLVTLMPVWFTVRMISAKVETAVSSNEGVRGPEWSNLGTGKNVSTPQPQSLQREVVPPNVPPRAPERLKAKVTLNADERSGNFLVGPFQIGQSYDDVNSLIRRDVQSPVSFASVIKSKTSATKDPTFSQEYTGAWGVRRQHLMSESGSSVSRFYDARINQSVNGSSDYYEDLQFLFSGLDTRSSLYFISRRITYAAVQKLQPSRDETVSSIVTKYGRPTFSGNCHNETEGGRRRFMLYFFKGKKLVATDAPPLEDARSTEVAYNRVISDVLDSKHLTVGTFCNWSWDSVQSGVLVASDQLGPVSTSDDFIGFVFTQGVNDDYVGKFGVIAMDMAMFRSLKDADQQGINRKYEARAIHSNIKPPL